MIYGYARVSSKKQLHGNSLEEQTATLTANGATCITAEQFTEKTTSRPKLQALIDSLQAGDTLMVTKLDRLARNVTEGIELIRALFKKEVKVHVLNIGLLENTSMGIHREYSFLIGNSSLPAFMSSTYHIGGGGTVNIKLFFIV